MEPGGITQQEKKTLGRECSIPALEQEPVWFFLSVYLCIYMHNASHATHSG